MDENVLYSDSRGVCRAHTTDVGRTTGKYASSAADARVRRLTEGLPGEQDSLRRDTEMLFDTLLSHSGLHAAAVIAVLLVSDFRPGLPNCFLRTMPYNSSILIRLPKHVACGPLIATNWPKRNFIA